MRSRQGDVVRKAYVGGQCGQSARYTYGVRRTERLFAITEHLRSRRTGTTASALAERFGVTLRTMYRDLDALREASLPLNADRGRGGGYALDRNYALPPVNFTAREAALLVVAGRWLTEMRVIPFVDTLGSALDKVQGALSSSAQRQLAEHARALDFIGVPARPVDARVRRAVERAWFEGLVLRIRYLDSSYVDAARRVRIKKVMMERTQTLLVCEDLESGEVRPFKLDRVLKAQVET